MISLEKHHIDNIELALATYPEPLGYGKVSCDHWDMAHMAIDLGSKSALADQELRLKDKLAPGREYANIQTRIGHYYQAIAALLTAIDNEREHLEDLTEENPTMKKELRELPDWYKKHQEHRARVQVIARRPQATIAAGLKKTRPK